MAKKPLKQPDVPPGARREFFTCMQELVLLGGDLSTSQLAERIGYSHQAVYKALTGPKMPSRHLTWKLADSLGGESGLARSIELWIRGVSEERAADGVSAGQSTGGFVSEPGSMSAGQSTGGFVSEPGSMSAGQSTGGFVSEPGSMSAGGSNAESIPTMSAGSGGIALKHARVDEHSTVSPNLSPREMEILRAWLNSESKSEVAKAVHVSPGTVNTHLSRIRAKYEHVGRPAPTKAALLARAVKDGFVDLGDFD